jgi:hypothetical protein
MRPLKPHDIVNQATKNGVGLGRLKISREQAAELRRIEAREGKDAGLKFILNLLRVPRI